MRLAGQDDMFSHRNPRGLAPLACFMLLGTGCAAASSTAGDAGGAANAGGSTDSSGAASGTSAGGSGAAGDDLGGGKVGGSSSGGAGGSALVGGCHRSADCPTVSAPGNFGPTQCLSPDQPTPPTACGAPGWCGQCNCPPQPIPPQGNGLSCQSSSDCPAASAGVETASLCDQNVCTECARDADCPPTTPSCTTVQGSFTSTFSFRACAQCQSDAQCSGATPHCQATAGRGHCVACLSNQECAQGVCVQGSCVAACSGDQSCASPLLECAANQRCQARACTSAADCLAPNAACQNGQCERRACQGDSECDPGGGCVNGACYETLGRCFTQMQAP
jgi:hypothetical protein